MFRYLEHIYSIPEESQQGFDYNGLSLQYLREERDTLADLRGFVGALGHYAPTTAVLYWTTTLIRLGVPLPAKGFWDNLSMRSQVIAQRKRIPSGKNRRDNVEVRKK